jgi:ABC-2 type transport system ATP-binding protein
MAATTQTPPAKSQPHRKVSAAAPLAEFLRVSKTYKDLWFKSRNVQAVQDVSFRIEPGEVFGLLGPNRAGKTTLVKLLLSLCKPTSGTVTRFGQALSVRSMLARIGYVHENHAFPRYLTAVALLEYYGALSLVPYDMLRVRIPALLQRVGLDDRSNEPIARFSKGMLQRLGIAQALVNEPDLLVLDEPTEGLDLSGRHLLRDIVAAIRGRKGSVLLISHVLTEVEALCDRVGVIVNSRLVYVGSMAALLQSSSESPRTLEQALDELYRRGSA